MTITVAVLDDDTGRARELAPWNILGPDVEVRFLSRIADRAGLRDALADADVVIAMRERTTIDRELLTQLGSLRLLITTGMANAAIDIECVRELGITMCGTSSMSGGVIELNWALILSLSAHLLPQDRSVRSGTWQTALAGTIGGKTLGLIGLGRLGAAMVPGARAFGMEVVAWSENLTDDQAAQHGVTLVTKGELFARSDVLAIHTRLSERTRGLVGAAELATMRSSALLINTSRGPIVDERALVDALTNGTIAGAGLDVYDVEPLPGDHPLTRLDNVVLAPHLGYATEANVSQMYREAIEDIVAFLAGAPLRVVAAGGR